MKTREFASGVILGLLAGLALRFLLRAAIDTMTGQTNYNRWRDCRQAADEKYPNYEYPQHLDAYIACDRLPR